VPFAKFCSFRPYFSSVLFSSTLIRFDASSRAHGTLPRDVPSKRYVFNPKSSGPAFVIYHLEVFLIGVMVGFLGGLFGKGGSAIATPLLSLAGTPGYIAVATPLPATVPGTLVASAAYWKAHLWNRTIISWSILIGLPSTALGSYLSKYTGAKPLLYLTGLLVLGFGLSFLIQPGEAARGLHGDGSEKSSLPSYWKLRLTGVAVGVGLISGLLANSGGFLLAPSYARFLKQPIKAAFASSLIVSAFLALPGTVVHWYLGHIAWKEMLILAAGSVPCSYLGANVALRVRSVSLERWYGLALTALGLFFLGKLFLGMTVRI
jgi:uncharacterized membrane protein YfcA